MANQPVPVWQPFNPAARPEAEQHQPAANYYHATPYYQPRPVNYYPNPPPAVVVGPQYCAGYAVDLVIVKKVWTLADDFEVWDVNRNVVLKAKGKLLALRDSLLISDAYGKPLMTLREKILTVHERWQVYRGDSSDPSDLLFTARTSSMLQFKTKLNVYLAHRTSEDVCDYRVEASSTKGSWLVYVGDSTTIAAQMEKKDGGILGKDKFVVRVSPNIDHAFVAALILILDAVVSLTDVSTQLIESAVDPVSILFN